MIIVVAVTKANAFYQWSAFSKQQPWGWKGSPNQTVEQDIYHEDRSCGSVQKNLSFQLLLKNEVQLGMKYERTEMKGLDLFLQTTEEDEVT